MSHLPRIAALVASLALAAPVLAQLPAGYSLAPATVLPDSLHEVYSGGNFRIRVERVARDSTERHLIDQAERLIPPAAAIEAAARKTPGSRNASAFEKAAARPGPRWWWRDWDGTWIPYALTGEAVAHAVDRVRTLSRGPVPTYFEKGWNHKAHARYTGLVERDPVPGVAYRVRLNLDFSIDCGGRCGLGFAPSRTVDFDASGNILDIQGDGVVVTRVR